MAWGPPTPKVIFCHPPPQYQKSLSNRATTSDSQEHEQFTAVYDTLENVAAQAKGGVAKSTPQATSHGSAAAVLPGIPPETVRIAVCVCAHVC